MLTDSFILSFSNYWNFDLECKCGKQKVAFWAWKVTRTFEKQAPVPQVLLPFFPLLPGGVLSLSTFSKSNAWDFHLIMTMQNFWKHPSNFWRSLMIFWRLLNIAETIWRCSDHLWALLKLFQRENFYCVVIQLATNIFREIELHFCY